MADYYFRARGLSKRGRFMMELSFWMGAFFFIFVSYMLWKLPPDARMKLMHIPGFAPMSLILFYVLVVVPFRRVLRLQVYTAVLLDTSRKGFHFKDSARDMVLSWRDLSEVRIHLDVHHILGVYVKEIYMRYSKGSIVLRPDPVTNPMEGVYEFADELKARAPKVKTYLTWFYPFCPYCREPLVEGKPCTCGEETHFINKLARPWQLFKDEMLFFILLGFINPKVMPAMIAVTVGAMLLPLVLVRREKIKLLPEARRIEAERVAEMRRQHEEAMRRKAEKDAAKGAAKGQSGQAPPREGSAQAGIAQMDVAQGSVAQADVTQVDVSRGAAPGVAPEEAAGAAAKEAAEDTRPSEPVA